MRIFVSILLLLATAACSSAQTCLPDAPARLIRASVPEYPESAYEAGLENVTVYMNVTIGKGGSLVNATIVQSSGNSFVDRSAISTARTSTYAAAQHACDPATSNVILKAQFIPPPGTSPPVTIVDAVGE